MYKCVCMSYQEDHHHRTSAPASLAASRESLLDTGRGSRSSTPSVDIANKRYSADLSKLDEGDILNQGGAMAITSNPTSATSRPSGGVPPCGHTQPKKTSAFHVPCQSASIT